MNMRKILKVLNPLIWLWNFIKYGSHLQTYSKTKKYEPYDFDNDTKYF